MGLTLVAEPGVVVAADQIAVALGQILVTAKVEIFNPRMLTEMHAVVSNLSAQVLLAAVTLAMTV